MSAAYPQEFYPGCPCYACDSPTWPSKWVRRMSLCPKCGNKRCRGAADHRRGCGRVEVSQTHQAENGEK